MEHNSESLFVVKEFTDNGKNTREVIAKGVTKQGFIDAYTEKGCVMRGGENPHFEDIYSGVVYKLENHFEQGGRLNTYEDLSKEMPSVINENSTCIPIVDLALENSPAIGSNFEGTITSSNDVVDAVNYILERKSGLESKDLVVTLILSQNNKVKGHLFSYRSNPIEKNADKQDFFRQIVSTLPAGIISVVVGNTEKSNSNEWNYFSSSVAKELIPFDIRFLDTLFYDFFGSKNSVSFSDSGKMRSGGLIANSYPDLSKEMPSFVSEIDKDLSQNNKISLVKKDKYCGEIPNKIERSFQAAKLFYSAWNKQKIGAVEEMFVLLLTATGRIISLYKHSLGARAGTILDNTIVSAVAVQSKAKGVIVCHNHPSGNLQPSQADIKVTQKLKEALFLCGINLVDSIIITPNENSYTSIFEEGLIMKNGGEIIYEDGGQVNRERDIEIAKTILMQLGGSNRLQMFTGAYNFVAVPYGVSFRIKNRSVNYVKIVLNAMDTYDIEFGRISGVNYKIVKELSGIYNDQLVEIFTRYTGMVLRLKEGGAIQGEENAEMVMNQNLQIRHHTEELEEILKSGKEVPAWVVSKISRAADSMSDATHYLEGTPDKMAMGGNTKRGRQSLSQKIRNEIKALEEMLPLLEGKDKKQVQDEIKNLNDTLDEMRAEGQFLNQMIERGEIPQNMPNPEPNFSIEQIKEEIEALKELLPFLEGDDKKEIEEQIDILNIALMQNENFGGGSDETDAPNADENFSQKFYIDFLNKKKGFKQDRISFNSYEEAKDWAIKNFERFDSDMIKRQMAEGGGVQDFAILRKTKAEMNIAFNTKDGQVYVGGINPKNKLYEDEKGYFLISDYGKFMGKKYPIKKYFSTLEQKVLSDYMNDVKYAKGGGVGEDKLELFYVMDNNGNVKNISKSYEKANDFLEKSLKFNGKIGFKYVAKSDWDSEKINTSNIKTYAKGGGVGEPYNSMTKYQLEKELKKLTDEWFDIRKSYSTDNHPRQIEIDKEKDKIITLLYGENFSGKGQKFKYANGGGVEMDNNTFVNILLDYGFVEKRGSYGIRHFYNKSKDFYASLDEKQRILDIYKDDDMVVQGREYNGYSIQSVIDFLNKNGFESGHKYAKGGGVGVEKYEIRDYNDIIEGRYDEQGLIDWAKEYAQQRKESIYINSVEDAKMYIESPDKNGNQNFEIYDYANGGEVGEFPPKGELTNEDNFLLKYEKKGGDYEFYIYKPETKKVSAYNQVEHICINSDFPYKMSYEQFINYLYAELYLDGRKYADGGGVFVCPVGTQIQSLIFDKSMFNLRQAKVWAKKNNFENDFVDGKLNTLRIRQKDPAMFTEDGFRTIQLRQGVQAVIGCPKKRTIRRKK